MVRYKVYKITNIINGKYYFGKTSKNIQYRFKQHQKNAKSKINRHLYDSMNKYGVSNFKIELISEFNSNEEASNEEIRLIKYYKSNLPEYGYNMTIGGDGGNTGKYYYGKSPYDWWVSKYGEEEAKNIKDVVYKKVSLKLKEFYKDKTWEDRFGNESESIKKKISDTLKRKGIKPPINRMCGESHPMYGKKHSLDSIEKIRKNRIGKSYDEIYDKETSSKIKKLKRERWTGENNPNYVNITKELIILILKKLILGEKVEKISKDSNLSTYLIRKFLKSNDINNIQKLRKIDKENITLKELIKKYE